MDAALSSMALIGNRAIGLLIDPVSRVYAPFLLVGLILAVYVAHREKGQLLQPHQNIFSKIVWFSRSALNDYWLIIINTLVVTTLYAFLLADTLPTAQAVQTWLAPILPTLAPQTTVWAALLFAFTLFVVDDFARYVSHYAEHRIPILWELHKVHHSAEVLNFLTAERHHPFASLFFVALNSSFIVLVNAVFITVFGDHISYTAILGGNLFWIATNLIGGALRHSPVWLSFGPHIEKWIISPAQHQIHHSTDPKHFDRNFGGSLAIWDRMFGTLYVTTPKRENIAYGLGDETRQYRSLHALYLLPLIKIMRMCFAVVKAPARTKRIAGLSAALVLAVAANSWIGRGPAPSQSSLNALQQIAIRGDVRSAALAANNSPAPPLAVNNQQWLAEVEAGNTGPLIHAVMNNRLSRRLAAEAKASQGRIEQVMIMDRRGALIAADHPTHDYDQSDEPKWQATAGAGSLKPLYEGRDNGVEQLSQAITDSHGQIIGAVTIRIRA
jgi:sterol desaturase/sphingolipid hydroxylase (fatty acid hydroxylase superfamily)